jgi:hypothetical protein
MFSKQSIAYFFWAERDLHFSVDSQQTMAPRDYPSAWHSQNNTRQNGYSGMHNFKQNSLWLFYPLYSSQSQSGGWEMEAKTCLDCPCHHRPNKTPLDCLRNCPWWQWWSVAQQFSCACWMLVSAILGPKCRVSRHVGNMSPNVRLIFGDIVTFWALTMSCHFGRLPTCLRHIRRN